MIWGMKVDRPFVHLMVQSVLMQASYFAVRPMVSYRALDLGATPSQLGVIAAAFGLFSLIAAIPVGRAADWIGAGRMTLLGIFFEILGVVVAISIDSVEALFWAGGILGLGHIMAMAGHQTLAAGRWPASERERVYNAYATFVSVGQAIGPVVGMFVASRWLLGSSTIEGIDSVTGLVAAGAFVLLALPGAWVLRERGKLGPRPAWPQRRRTPAPEQASSTSQVLRRQWPVMLTSAMVVAALDVLATFLPLWAQTQGVEPAVVGSLLASRAIFTLLIRLVAGRLVRWGGRIRVMSLSISGACIGFAILPLVDARGAFLAMALLGFGLGLAAPMTLVMLMDEIEGSRQGSAVGIRLAGNRLGQMGLPLAMGGLLAFGDVSLVWWATAIVLAVSVIFMLIRHVTPSDPGSDMDPA